MPSIESDAKLKWYIILWYVIIYGLFIAIWWNTTGAHKVEIPDDAVAAIQNITFSNLPMTFVLHGEKIDTIDEKALTIGKEDAVIRKGQAIDGSNEATVKAHWKRVNTNERQVYHIFITDKKTGSMKQHILYMKAQRYATFLTSQFTAKQLNMMVYHYYIALKHAYAPKDPRKVTRYSESIRLGFTWIHEEPSKNETRATSSSMELMDGFMEKLKPAFKLHRTTQVIRYGKLPVAPVAQHVNNNTVYMMDARSMQLLLNHNADWKFESAIDPDQTLQFVLFVPSQNHTPLYIKNYRDVQSTHNAYILSQWGGVVIHTPHHPLNRTMNIFLTQCRTLLGLSQPGASIPERFQNHLQFERAQEGVADWEVDMLMRAHTKEYLRATLSNLKKFILVAQSLDIIVTQTVVDLVNESMQQVHDAVETAKNLDDQFKAAKKAMALSLKAYHHESLDMIQYMSFTNKMGIYVPICIPILATLMPTLLRLFKKK